MSDPDSVDLQELSGPDWCRHVGDTAVEAFVAFVIAQASDPVSPVQLAALAKRFRDDHALMADRYRALWQAGGWTRRGSDLPDRRGAPLQRLLVERFAHLLAPAGSALTQLADGSPAIQRAAIPGILSAMATMTPGELWDQARRRCIDIVAGLRMHSGADFAWEQAEREPEVMQLVDDVRMAVLPYFDDFAKRRRWFVTVVDRHQADHYGPDASGRPVVHKTLLDESGFDRVFAAIFRDLALRVVDPSGRASLAARYGFPAIAALARLLEHLTLGKAKVPA
jgi:hypothetical protein